MGSDTTSRRNQNVMCGRCRHDKRKCTPVDRDWDNQRQKCERCSRLQYDCGPPERAPRKSRQKSLTFSSPYEEHGRRNFGLSSQPSGLDLQCHNFHSRATSPFPSQTAPWSGDFTEATVVNAAFRAERVNQLPNTHFGAILTQLGDLYATCELLRRELMLCHQVTEWLGVSGSLNSVKEAIGGYVKAMQEQLAELLKKAYDHLASNDELEIDQFLLQRYLTAHESASLTPSLVSSSTGDLANFGAAYLAHLQHTKYTLHQNTCTYSDAEYICNYVWDLSQCPYRSSETRQTWLTRFRNASTAIGRVMFDAIPSKLEHKEMLFGQGMDMHTASARMSGYPIEHLAVMYGSPFLSLEFSWEVSLDFNKLDLLKRTPLHTAVYAGKLNESKRIVKHDLKAVSRASADGLGLTPIMIAVYKDDVPTAQLLLHYGADDSLKDPAGRDVIATAIRRGNHSMVELLRRHGRVACSLSATPEHHCGVTRTELEEMATSLPDEFIKDEQMGDTGQPQSQTSMLVASERDTHDLKILYDHATMFPVSYPSSNYVSDLSWSISSGSSCSDLHGKIGTWDSLSTDDVSNLNDYREIIHLLQNLPKDCKDLILQQAESGLKRETTVRSTGSSTDLDLLRRCLGTTSDHPADTKQTKDVSCAIIADGSNEFSSMADLHKDSTEDFLLEWQHYGFDSTLLEYPDMPYDEMDLSTLDETNVPHTT